jgi:transposase
MCFARACRGVICGSAMAPTRPIYNRFNRPLNFVVTGGQVHDNQVVGNVLKTPRPPLVVTGDKAYDSEKVRQEIKDDGAVPVIPSRRTATKKAYRPKRIYRRRHKTENYFCRVKDWRRIATRFDKLARNFLATARRRTLLD